MPKMTRGSGRPFSKDNPGKPFTKGNPGRPVGLRHRRTMIAQALLDGEETALMRKCIALALEGDPTALKLCIERLIPPRKEWPVEFTMPTLHSGTDTAAAIAAIMQAAAEGKILLSQAVEFGKLLETYARTVNFAEAPWPENLTDDQMRAAILRMRAAAAIDTEWREEEQNNRTAAAQIAG